MDVFDEQEPGSAVEARDHVLVDRRGDVVVQLAALGWNRFVAGARRETEDRGEQGRGHLRIHAARPKFVAQSLEAFTSIRVGVDAAPRFEENLYGMESGPGVEQRRVEMDHTAAVDANVVRECGCQT